MNKYYDKKVLWIPVLIIIILCSMFVNASIPTTDNIMYLPLSNSSQYALGDYNAYGGVVGGYDGDRAYMEFDGSDDYLDIPDAPNNRFNNLDFSVCQWVKIENLGLNSMIIDKRDKNDDGWGLLWATSGKKLGVYLNTIDSWTSDNVILDSNWHFICITADKTTNKVVKIFVDNIDTTTTQPDISGVTLDTTKNIRIGMNSYDTTLQKFDGKISNVAIYNKVLTPQEISDLYANETDVAISDLVWANDLSEQSDYSNNLNNAEAYNGVLYDQSENAYSFDGSDDYLNINDDLSSSKWAISLWAKKTNTGTMYLYDRDGDDFAFYFSNEDLKVYSTAGANVVLKSSVSQNTWFNIIVTYDGTTLKSYFDGIETNHGTQSLTNWDSSDIVNLARATSSASYFDGLISNVLIYNDGLTSTEISNIYNAGRNPANPYLTSDEIILTNATTGLTNLDSIQRQVQCNFTSQATTNDPANYSVTWYRNSTHVTDFDYTFRNQVPTQQGSLYYKTLSTGSNTGSVDAGLVTGDEWSCEVTAVNKLGTDTLKSSATTIPIIPSVVSDLSKYNMTNVNFNVEINYTLMPSSSTCGISTNDTAVICTYTTGLSGNGTLTSTCTISNGEYTISAKPYCTDSTDYVYGALQTIIIDTTDPVLAITQPNPDNSSTYTTNSTINITTSDVNNYRLWLNVTDPHGKTAIAKEYDTQGHQIYSVNETMNNTISGTYTVFIQTADGHTAKKIPVLENLIDGKELHFEPSSTNIVIKPSKPNDFITPNTIKRTDRYEFIYDKTKTAEYKDYDEFVVEANSYIDIVKDSEYPGHLIIQDGEISNWKWIDFATEEKYFVKVDRITSNKVSVKVFGYGNDYHFKSIGLLNIVNTTLTYYYESGTVNVGEIYESDILSGYQTNFYSNISYNGLIYKDIRNVSMQYNGDYHDATFILSQDYFTGKSYIYDLDLSPDTVTGSSATRNHNWRFDLQKLNNDWVTIETSNLTQTEWNPQVGSCVAPRNYLIADINWFDEISGVALEVNYTLQTNSTDNIEYYSYTSTGEDDNTKICTNLPDTTFEYSWTLLGKISASKSNNESYIGRTWTFDTGNTFVMNNKDPLQLNLSLIKLEESSTIKYQWFSRQFKELSGVMNVYRCDSNEPKLLSESIPIVEGISYANLELFSGVYYYEIVVDGITYINTDTFSQCLPLSATDYTYFVDILNTTDTKPVIGFQGIECSLGKSGNIYSLVWTNNKESDEPITGCFVKYKQSALGNTINETVCTSTGNTLLREINGDSDNYFISGIIYQGSESTTCGTVEVNAPVNGGGLLGTGAIIGVILLMMFVVLITAGIPQLQLFLLAISIITSMWIGIISFTWVETSGIVLLLIFGALIGRYTRK